MALDWDSLIKPRVPLGTSRTSPTPRTGSVPASSVVKSTVSNSGSSSGRRAPIGVGTKKDEAEKEEQELLKALLNAQQRINTDPLAAGERDRLVAELEKLASGKKEGDRGVLGGLGDIGKKVGLGVLYGATRPVAGITSVLKETVDVLQGDGASFKDLVDQAKAWDTMPSKYIKKTGNRYLDTALGIVADAALDPLTYVTFGASAYAGRAGRIALAAKAAEREVLERAPSLAAKLADGSIARYGEWALDDVERAALGVDKGLSWSFGGKSTIGKEGTALRKLSEGAATVIGKTTSRGRAALGKSEVLRPLQTLTSPKSVKAAGLARYGRETVQERVTDESVNAIIKQLGGYSAAMRGKSLGRVWVKVMKDSDRELAKDVSTYERETGRRLVNVAEGVETAIDQREQDLVDRMLAYKNRAYEEANNITSKFSSRRGVSAYDIGHRENHVPHVITPEAKEWLAKEYGANRAMPKSISDMLDIDEAEFISGPGTMRARKLEEGTEFLGVPLRTNIGDGAASMAEINKISMDKLGFKWFEEDAATYLNSYINSLGSQVKRVGMVDRLFDYGSSSVKGIDYKMVPDKEVVSNLRASGRQINSAMNTLGNDMRTTGTQAASAAKRQIKIAERMIARKAGDPLLTDLEIIRITDKTQAARKAFNQAEKAAKKRGGAIERSFQTLAAPHRARLEALEKAISENNQDEIAAVLLLEDLHVKTFPNMKKRPSDPKRLAEEIVTKTSSRAEQRLRALQTRKDRLSRKIGPTGRLTSAAREAEEGLNASRLEMEQLDQEIADLTEVVQRSNQDFPDGIMFIRKEDIDPTTGAVRDGGVKVFSEPPEGTTLDDYVVSYSPVDTVEPGVGGRVIRPLDSEEDFVDFIDGLGNGIGAAIAKLGDIELAETFGEYWDDMMFTRGGMNAIDPSFSAAEPELAEILAFVDAVGREGSRAIGQPEFRQIMAEGIDEIAKALDSWMTRTASLEPSFPADVFEDGYDMLRYAIGDIGNPAANIDSTVIGVDLSEFPMLDFDSDGVILNSGHLERMLEPVPETSTVYRSLDDYFITGTSIDATGRLMEAQGMRNPLASMIETSQGEIADIAEKIAETRAGITSAGRAQGGIRSAQNKLESKVAGAQETVARTAEETPKLVKEAKSSSKSIDALERKMKDEMAADPVLKTRDESKRNFETLQAQLDQAKGLRKTQEEWAATEGVVYQDDIEELQRVLAERPPKGESAEMTNAWNAKVTRTLQNLQAAQLDPAQRSALQRIITAQHSQEAQLAVLESQKLLNDDLLAKALIEGNLVEVIEEGWRNISSLGVKIPTELEDMLFSKVRSLKNPSEFEKLKKMYFAYHNFFKITAMLSPGFIVRNSYTAAFNNFVAGVTPKEVMQGIRFARSVIKDGLDTALNKVPASQRSMYEQAYQASVATGAGMTVDDFLMPVPNGKVSRLLNNKAVKKWSTLNEGVELAARFSLGINAVKRGAEFDDVVATIRRYHFDYSDISAFDEAAKAIIPFWIFASRNIPLQLVNQISRPKVYNMYESMQRNMQVEEGEVILPRWLAERRPLALNKLIPGMPADVVLNPDLPQIDMAEQIRMFADPMRLVSQANPLPKLIIELMGNRQLGLNIPFKQKPSDVRGPLDWPAYLAGLPFGQSGSYGGTGGLYTSEKAAYAIPNLLPTLAQLQRLIPQLGGKESYQDRQSSSWAGYFGLPIRRVSQNEQANEIIRRQFLISNYLSNKTKTGYLTPKEQS